MKFGDSRHAQLSIYTVLHEEFNFEVKNDGKQSPEVKKEENRNLNFFKIQISSAKASCRRPIKDSKELRISLGPEFSELRSQDLRRRR